MGAIKANRLYCDEQSLDKKGSLKEKRRYKITGSIFVYTDCYIFMTTTSEREWKNCNAKHYIKVNHKEWGQKNKNFIKEYSIFKTPTLIDYTNLDICKIDEASEKFRKGIIKILCKVPKDIIKRIKEKVDVAPVETLRKESIIYAKFSFGTYKKNQLKILKKTFGI
jgi:hypothetical protein